MDAEYIAEPRYRTERVPEELYSLYGLQFDEKTPLLINAQIVHEQIIDMENRVYR